MCWGTEPEQDRAGAPDLGSLLSGLTPAIPGSGHQGVVVFSSLSDGSKSLSGGTSALGLWRLKEVGSSSGSGSL